MLTVNKKGKVLVERYSKMSSDRNQYLDRGRTYSRQTLPYILPHARGTSERGGSANKQGYSSVGAEAVNFLANRLVVTLFPPNSPFFALDLSSDAEKELNMAGIEKTAIQKHLSQVTQMASRKQRELKMRSELVTLMKHLLISGNALISIDNKKGTKVLGIDSYVCKRDLQGNLREYIIKEFKPITEYSEEIQQVIQMARKSGMNNNSKDESTALYTRCKVRRDGLWMVQQSVDDLIISQSVAKFEDLPYILVRWNTCSGESYGRGLVEDYSGDFHVLEFLSMARAKGAALMMDVKYLVAPGSQTDVQSLNKAEIGEYVQGRDGDIIPVQLDKYADHNFIQAILDEYTQRIGRAFMMGMLTQRDAERVTTVEIRRDAAEIEQSLGGVYSSLAEELQRPIAILILALLDSRLDGKDIVPNITTGLDALGRASDLDRINQFVQMVAQAATFPEPVQARMKWGHWIDTITTALHMDSEFLMNDDEFEEFQSDQEDRMVKAQVAEKTADAASKIAVKTAGEDNAR